MTQDFSNPRNQDWWLWRPRDIVGDSVYQIEWSWTVDARSPDGADKGTARLGR